MSSYAPLPAARITAEVDAMHALAAGMAADRAEIVAILTTASRDTDYDRLLAAALKEVRA
jgi:hypothetical protein